MEHEYDGPRTPCRDCPRHYHCKTPENVKPRFFLLLPSAIQGSETLFVREKVYSSAFDKLVSATHSPPLYSSSFLSTSLSWYVHLPRESFFPAATLYHFTPAMFRSHTFLSSLYFLGYCSLYISWTVKWLTQKLVPVQDWALAQHMLDCPVHQPPRYWAATRP